MEIHALLGPKAQNLMSSHGGEPEITPEMVAASMSSAPRGACCLIRVKVGDHSAMRGLREAFRQRIAYESCLRRWKTGPHFWEHFDGLVDAAILFYVPPSTCQRCKGQGHIVLRTKQVRACPVCSGAGNKDAKESDKARVAGIKYDAWLETWADRYRLATAILSEWEDMADCATRRVFWD